MTSSGHRPDSAAFLALLRHARARRAGPGEPDSERELTPEGRAELDLQVARLAAKGFGCDELWTSPWRRARETAAVLSVLCGVEPRVHEGLGSEPDSSAGRALAEEASSAATVGRVVLVGHMPWLAELSRGLGADDVRDLACSEMIWLSRAAGGRWVLSARLAPG